MSAAIAGALILGVPLLLLEVVLLRKQPRAILLFSLALLVVGLYAAHLFLPNRKLPLADITPGIVLTIIAWLVLATGFSWYLRNYSSFTSTYASLSGIFAVMFFISPCTRS